LALKKGVVDWEKHHAYCQRTCHSCVSSRLELEDALAISETGEI